MPSPALRSTRTRVSRRSTHWLRRISRLSSSSRSKAYRKTSEEPPRANTARRRSKSETPAESHTTASPSIVADVTGSAANGCSRICCICSRPRKNLPVPNTEYKKLCVVFSVKSFHRRQHVYKFRKQFFQLFVLSNKHLLEFRRQFHLERTGRAVASFDANRRTGLSANLLRDPTGLPPALCPCRKRPVLASRCGRSFTVGRSYSDSFHGQDEYHELARPSIADFSKNGRPGEFCARSPGVHLRRLNVSTAAKACADAARETGPWFWFIKGRKEK